MAIQSIFKKVSSISIAALALVVMLGNTTFAHVVVKPAEVVTAGFQTFTISVPNEKDIATTSIKLLIPKGLNYVQPTQKTGWQIAVEKQGAGDDAKVASITWSSGEVAAGFRDDFTFSAQVPEKATELQWKAYQTYADGTTVSWDKVSHGDNHESEDENSGPFSITDVVSETAQDAAMKKADQAAADAKTTADRALYVGIAALLLSIVGIFFATRKK